MRWPSSPRQPLCERGHSSGLSGHGEPTVDRLTALAALPKVVAVGETGLDYFRQEGDLDWQRARFRTHIRAAREAGKPLVIHTRAAAADTLAIMREERADEVGGVMHCFTETWDVAQAAIDLGFHISFSGIVTFKNATELKDVARRVPLERMLIETDSPYLAPVPFRGKRNEPSYVPHVALEIARLRDLPVADIAAATSTNFFRLFEDRFPCSLAPVAAFCLALSLFAFAPIIGAQQPNDFLAAVANDRGAAVTAMLAKGIDPNTVDANDGAGADCSCAQQQRNGRRRADRREGQRECAQPFGDTALAIAALKGYLPIAKALVAAGADVNGGAWPPITYASNRRFRRDDELAVEAGRGHQRHVTHRHHGVDDGRAGRQVLDCGAADPGGR